MNEEQKAQALQDIVGSDENVVVAFNHIPDSTTTITCNITRHYGQISIELGASIQAIVNRPDDFTACYSDLFDHVTEQHRLLAGKLTGAKPAPVSNGGGGGGNDGYSSGDSVISIESIFVEKKNGKTYYSVKGGKFSKFGVRLWLDDKVIGGVKDEMKWHELPEGDNKPPVTMKAEIDFEAGKPKKIARIFLAGQDEIPF